MSRKKQSLNEIMIAARNLPRVSILNSVEIRPHPEDQFGRNWDVDPVSKMDPKLRNAIEALRTRLIYDPGLD